VLCSDLLISVPWETPLGLTVQQPYTKLKGLSEVKWSSELEATESEDVLLAMQRDRRTALTVPNVIKQKNGFPPNFVHSLDSTHMMLTAMHLWNVGCTFASVHDCYWTHACSVEEMNRVCRDQFVKMHSSPILEDLSQGFIGVLDNYLRFATSSANSAKAKMLFEAIPPKGNLDLNVVRDSTFFFS
jgi:DNA-directed RNA polymerase